MIIKETKKLEDIAVRGVTANKSEAKITIRNVPDKKGVAARIFNAVSKEGINVDIIVQNVSHTKQTDISFTVPKRDLAKALRTTRAIAKKVGCGDILFDDKIARISIVGSGMRSHSGIAAKMFQVLADNKINIEMISTSEISISCIIALDAAAKALKSLHKRFGLDK